MELAFCGDIFPANLHYTIGFGIASRFVLHKGKPWIKYLRKYFQNSDIVFGNLESPLIFNSNHPEATCFAGSEDFARFLNQIGISIVTIANNHILEQGLTGFTSTKEILKKNEIKYVGDILNTSPHIETFSINGMTVGFAAFSGVRDCNFDRSYAFYTESSVFKVIDKMVSMKLNYKIIGLHWGDEYINIPSHNQIEQAHKIIDRGADIIVGHHPHVIQPIEEYRNGLIIYSLGNFLFDMLWSRNVRTGMIVIVNLNKEKKMNYKIIPIFLSKEYIPVEANRQRFFNFFRYHEKMMKKNIAISLDHYVQYYKRHLRFNTLYQRLLMKIFLILRLPSVSLKTWKILFKKLVSKIEK